MTAALKLTPPMVETALQQVEQKCGTELANLLRAYILSLRAAIDDDEVIQQDGESIHLGTYKDYDSMVKDLTRGSDV